MGGVVHGVAGVEQDGQQAVGLAAIALQVGALGAGEDVPIDVAQIVAGRVGAVLGELLAEAEIGRAVQAGDEAVDDRLGDQVEAGDAGQNRRDRESAAHAQAPFGRRHVREQAPEDFVRIDAIGFGVEIQQDAMAQDRDRPAR